MTAPEAASELQSAAEPLHITAALAQLAQLRDTFHLPHPIAVRFEKSTGIGVVDVSTFGETTVWADALGVPERARLSTTQTNRSSTHSAWVKWNGWDLRVVAHVDAPVVPKPLPVHVSDERAQTILDGLNARPDWETAFHWLAGVREVVRTTGFRQSRGPEVELCDGTLMAWQPDVCRWEFVTAAPAELGVGGCDTPPAEQGESLLCAFRRAPDGWVA